MDNGIEGSSIFIEMDDNHETYGPRMCHAGLGKSVESERDLKKDRALRD
jgi:hypothetical protein